MTWPSLTGSLPVANTIGTVAVAALAASAAGVLATITATRRSIKSACRNDGDRPPRFAHILRSALERVAICSNDPVCADHEPDDRSGDRATRRHLSAKRLHVALLSGSRVNLAIPSHSAARFRNSSSGSM